MDGTTVRTLSGHAETGERRDNNSLLPPSKSLEGSRPAHHHHPGPWVVCSYLTRLAARWEKNEWVGGLWRKWEAAGAGVLQMRCSAP